VVPEVVADAVEGHFHFIVSKEIVAFKKKPKRDGCIQKVSEKRDMWIQKEPCKRDLWCSRS